MVRMIVGIPNSGKTTYSKKYDNVIHLDTVEPTDGSPIKTICRLLENETDDVCVEGVLLFAKDRKRIIDSYKGAGRRVCEFLDVPPEECIRREDRGRAKWMVLNCYDVLEPPTYEEGWDEIVVMKEVPYIGGGTSNDENNTPETSTERSLYSTERKDEGVQAQDI